MLEEIFMLTPGERASNGKILFLSWIFRKG